MSTGKWERDLNGFPLAQSDCLPESALDNEGRIITDCNSPLFVTNSIARTPQAVSPRA